MKGWLSASFFRVFLYFQIVVAFPCFAEKTDHETIRIVSYNVENLFDCEDDPLTDDNAFTPEGEYQWTEGKYKNKLNNISRAITAAGGWAKPVIIGLCEVENKKVLTDLTQRTQLKVCGYQFVHKDSPDQRGVDVALAYLPDRFRIVSEDFIPVPIEEGRPTRDILHATGILFNGDTLHVFVNHWPSRYGGELESEHKRFTAAKTLRKVTDSLQNAHPRCNIIIMGDFNDYPYNASIKEVLGAEKPTSHPAEQKLYNLCEQFAERGDVGSHKFGGEWGMLDHLIVSGPLLDPKHSIHTSVYDIHICQEDFLLKEDKTGKAPKRAFMGAFYAYGYSDHLPIFLDLDIINHE
ncbi:MAG: endonuclease [Paludibacteraceae bacterium]|nr:endonuclease [Paludibacteraceae bacterium]